MTVPVDVTSPDVAPVVDPGETPEAFAGRSLKQLAWIRIKRDRVAMVSISTLVIIIGLVLAAPIISHLRGVGPDDRDPSSLDTENAGIPLGWHSSGISAKHWLGVEPGTGRDIMAMLLDGARISLFIATSATVVTVFVGVSVGIISGYSRGRLDTVLARFMDLLLAFPLLLIVLAMTNSLTDRLQHINLGVYHVNLSANAARIVYLILVFSVFGWPYLARIVRGQVIGLREREFVEASVAMGASTRRILFVELLPNLWAPVLVFATLALPSFIATEAGLSYLGVGILPPQATWGKMLADSVSYFNSDPMYLFIPGLLLLIVVLSFNLLGDALRDAIDPRAGRV